MRHNNWFLQKKTKTPLFRISIRFQKVKIYGNPGCRLKIEEGGIIEKKTENLWKSQDSNNTKIDWEYRGLNLKKVDIVRIGTRQASPNTDFLLTRILLREDRVTNNILVMRGAVDFLWESPMRRRAFLVIQRSSKVTLYSFGDINIFACLYRIC